MLLTKKVIRVLGLRTAPVVAQDVHGIYAPWDSAPVSVDVVWLGGWYVACGGGGAGARYKLPLWALKSKEAQALKKLEVKKRKTHEGSTSAPSKKGKRGSE
jgi:hypothetical protein